MIKDGYYEGEINKRIQRKTRVPDEWTPIIELQNNKDIIWLIKW